jgi:hypothetical protein
MSDIPPEIDAKEYGNTVAAGDFPLTPMEAWFIMRGYWVKSKQPVNVDRLMTLPGKLEMIDGYIGLWNA